MGGVLQQIPHPESREEVAVEINTFSQFLFSYFVILSQ